MKRKLRSPVESPYTRKKKKKQEAQKTPFFDSLREVEAVESLDPGELDDFVEDSSWRNLELILALQSRDLGVEKKVDLGFDFVKAHVGEREDDKDEECEAVNTSRLIIFLSDWIQSILISTEKKSKTKGDTDFDPPLDLRCWEIFKFCLKQSSTLDVSLNLSRNLLKPIGYVVKNLSSVLMSLHLEEYCLTGQGFEVYSSVLACVGLLFSSKGSLSNESLDLWISTVDAVLELVHKALNENIEDCQARNFVLNFSCLLLEPFSKFLRIHPTKKNGFRDFVDKLLEPLLCVLGLLHLHIDKNKSTPDWGRTLVKLIEEILSHGLFHSAHIDGFLGLRGTERYLPSRDEKSKGNDYIPKSYHRFLFVKLESILSRKKEMELSCLGDLFSLFVNQVMKQEVASNQLQEGKLPPKSHSILKQTEEYPSDRMLIDTSFNGNGRSEKSHCSIALSGVMRKSFFDFFLVLMEPIVFEMRGCVKSRPEGADIYCVLKSSNSLLFSLAQERVYLKMEDTSEGACLYFLKMIFKEIVSLASLLQNCYLDHGGPQYLVLSAKELIAAIGYLLEIDYAVVENDLVSLWLMILTYMEIGLSSGDASDECSVTSLTLGLGCQVINLYSELRQINSALFALCKAVRLMISRDDDVEEMKCTRFFSPSTSFTLKRIAKSVEILFSSQGLRCAIHSAIKSIPEGQASGCIRHLTTDISETMDWIKVCYSTTVRKELVVLAELLAGALLEIYTLMLDTLTITTGNSNHVGLSIDSMMNVIRPYLCCLVSLHSDSVRKFLFAVTGLTLDAVTVEKKRKICMKSTRLFIVFFFRVYMSSRGLYRQVISLMPPKKSKEMANAMGDSFVACCGNDWIKKKSWSDEGYFSWICQPSASILDITKHVLGIYLEDDSSDCCLLIYLLHRMALQRLVDLNRHIKSLDYVSQLSDNQIHEKSHDQTGLSHGRKRNKRLRKHLSVLKQEGEDLTNFLLSYISSVFEDQETLQAIDVHNQWDLSISAIHKKSLPTAILWVLSQHIDIWCSHAKKKKLKTFLSWMIRTSFPRTLNRVDMPTINRACDVGGGTLKKKIVVQQVSSELLNDSVLYEHEFVCRNFVLAFCHILDRTAVELLKDYAEEKVIFNSQLDWSEVLLLLESSVVALSDKSQSETCFEADGSHLDSIKFTACQNLLDLLCQMPKEYLKAKSFQLYPSHVLDLERLIVLSLLRCNHKLSSGDQQNLLSLFNTCRRTLKNIFMISYEKMVGGTKSPLSDCSSLVLWLFKSAQASITFQGTFRKNFTSKARGCIFSLMDHTAYIFLKISKYQFSRAMLMDLGKPSEEQPFLPEVVEEQKSMNGSDLHLYNFIRADNINRIFLISGSLTEEVKSLMIPFRDALSYEANGFECKMLTLDKLSFAISCFGGFLWGIASAASQRDMHKNHQKAKLKLKSEAASMLCGCIDVLCDFVEVFRQSLFVDEDMEFGNQTDTNSTDLLDDNEESNGLMDVELGLVETGNLKKHCFDRLINGDCAEMALVLRQLLIASASILRLNLHVHGLNLSPRFVTTLTRVSCVLLSGLADINEAPKEFSFVWLDGALKFLEELGSQVRSSNPSLKRNFYSKLIELHLKVIGKCISLQGKEATLASHQTALGTKAIHAKKVTSENMFSSGHWLDEFKERLRMSFNALIQNSSELHLLSAVHALERALTGVWEFCPAIYKIQMGNRDGGRIPLTAVAGIDCLDLILEHASGRKRLNVVKRHIQSLIAALFSIIAHLQSSFIFFATSVFNQGHNCPDPGAVILMCVEVLTRISGKHALFQMDAWHISQSMRLPGAFFQDFLQLTDIGLPVSNFKDLRNDLVASSKSHQMDREFSISLYAACCRLLYTIVKHHKSETEGCIATLQESITVLLHCLERAGNGSDGFCTWKVEEGNRCASFLRRIYEELRQQKDVLGQHCFKFLSSYIWVSSGFGPLKIGFRREVDEALRPGVYALIDSCSPNDLQYLHTVFGEGPCRNSLATLQQDYKLNFKYEGKV